MDISGDASAFFLQGLMLAKLLQLALQFLSRHIVNDAANAPQKAEGGGAEKPPGLPYWRLYC